MSEIMCKDVVVVKIGTSTLVTKNGNDERLDEESFFRIGRQVCQIQASGVRVILVSSAAITAGMVALGVRVRPSRSSHMSQLQLLASVGWRNVLNMWADALRPNPVAELLLTRTELNQTRPRRQAISTIQNAWLYGAVPIVNENDSITHEEVTFGDNDMLAAQLAVCIGMYPEHCGSVNLVILSDVDGVYADPSDRTSVMATLDLAAKHQFILGGKGNYGTGGIVSKLAAAQCAVSGGVQATVANGRTGNVLLESLGGVTGTRFWCSSGADL